MGEMTPHLEAKKGEIAETVLMPGDPLRAKHIAETYLEDVTQYNSVRGMYGFTGTYKGVRVSIQGSGMGVPSMGIYSYELFQFYDVKNIIRIGSAGSIQEDLHLGDIVLGIGASTDSNYQNQYRLPGIFSATADYSLIETAVNICRKKEQSYNVGNIVCSDIFYSDDDAAVASWRKMGCLAIEMESTALYMNAAKLGKKALCMLTVSDEILTGKKLTAMERQVSFNAMMEVALETAISM